MCPSDTDPAPTPVYDARRLVGSDACARLVLDGQVYTLRITRAEKLILTK
ncbi:MULTISPECIES: hemin uptake protein HemP [unclassified Roseivivax]|nr:hemin uptake protein HemP [Roseivivax sp. GX 12232]MCE0504027.1 hemin uptake protein HemP [Roseivivax sp. GX 12232]